MFIVIFFTDNVWKTVLVVPMLITSILTPQAQTVNAQILRIRTSATILLTFLIFHSAYQNFSINFQFDRTIIELIGSLTCFYIVNIENVNEKIEELEEGKKKEIFKEAVYKFTTLLRIFGAVLIISSTKYLKYQPIINISLAIIEYIMRNNTPTAKFSKYVNLINVALGAVCFIPFSATNSESLSQIVFISTVLTLVFTISKQILLFKAGFSIENYNYRHLSDPDAFWKSLKEYPNLNFFLDRFWSFLLPIPLLFCIWSLSMFEGSIAPWILGLAAVFVSCALIIQIHWSLIRTVVSKVFKIIFISVLFAFLIYEKPSTTRFWKTLLIISSMALISLIEEVYRTIWEKSRSGGPLPVLKSFYSPSKFRIYFDSIQRLWTVTSPLVSALMISILTISTLYSKWRLILLGFSGATALLVRSEGGQMLWALIEVYVILEQTFLLFLSQKDSLPSKLTEIETSTVIANLAILLIAEGQRLSWIPSIFAPKSLEDSMDQSKVNIEYPNCKARIVTPQENVTVKYENSLIWSSITFFGKVTNVTSLLALMATLIFYPQVVELSFQTCVYSLWACLFTFLFYRPEVTAKLRFIFVGALAGLSVVFFVYNLYILKLEDLKSLKAIFNDENGKLSEQGITFILHGLVFWFSCTSLFVMQLTTDNDEAEAKASESDESPSPKADDSSKMIGVKFVSEASSILERLFVLQWTRSCALLAFLAASFNPSIFGIIHVIIGCVLAWKNILSPKMYIPMILWLLCSTFFPVIFYRITPEPYLKHVPLLVGDVKSIESTICLTLWALILFLQPVFTRCLMKLTTEKERETSLVSFQLLPQEETALASQENIESFENSSRYYLSNWFLEFHNEIMVSVLLIGAVTRKNFYGMVYAVLTLIHVIVPIFGRGQGLDILAKGSFFLQMVCYIMEYCLLMVYNHKAFDHYLVSFFKNPKSQLYAQFFGLSTRGHAMIFQSVLVGIYVILTVRWYLTSQFYQDERPERRFDNHWCRLCNQVSFKSKHSFSKIKHNIHLYLGWISHGFLFLTAIYAFDKPTIPAVLLLIFSLIFFFYGEASILIPKLRNNVYVVLGIILIWTLTDSLMTFWFVFIVGEDKNSIFRSKIAVAVYKHIGMTNVLKYFDSDEAVFETGASKFFLGITAFLILLQIRLYTSKAWPFVIARLYHSYATSAKRAQLFKINLQASINFQQRNLAKAAEHVKKQISSMQNLDISDWKKICYVPKVEETEAVVTETKFPEYGDDGVRQRKSINEFRSHLDEASNQRNNTCEENDHLDELQSTPASSSEDLMKPLTLKESKESTESLVPSDLDAKKELHDMEGNFYWYTFILTMRSIVKYLLSVSRDYRRLLNRPSSRSSLRIIFHHKNHFYRVQFLSQLMFDVLNANFDLILDFFVMEAQVFHSSGFSFFMVVIILLVVRMQRPYTSKNVHNYALIFCAGWILFNFIKAVFWDDVYRLSAIGNGSFRSIDVKKVISLSVLNRILGLHIHGKISEVTMRPTLILLALSYKRSLMRQLGLWDYGRGIQMAKIYYQTEEDLDEIGELNVPGTPTEQVDVIVSDSEDESNGIITESDDESLFKSSSHSEAISVVSDDEPNNKMTFLETIKELFMPSKVMPWRDFYVLIFVSDFICLFTLMYYWGDLTLGPSATGGSRNSDSTSFFTDMINQNMIPAPLVNMIILSTFILILDRALYVSKNHFGKFLLQIVTLVGYHVYIFFYLPQFYFYPLFTGLGGVRFWYLCKWIYWISSALQLKYNYPPLRTETFLGGDYGIVGSTLHNVYRSIPFIEELKTIIDWSVTPSALGLWPWLKYSDIFERLYAVQCARAFQRTFFGRHQFGMPLNQMSKMMQGVTFVSLSVLILWSPFLILSRESMMSPNTVRSFKLEISIENHGPAFLSFTQEQFGPTLDKESKEFKVLKFKEGVNPYEVDPNYFTTVNLPNVSQSAWNISEASRLKLMSHLRDKTEPSYITMHWIIERENSQNSPIIEGASRERLSDADKEKFAALLDPETDKTLSTTVDLPSILPYLVNAPLSGTSTVLSKHDGRDYQIIKVCPKSTVKPDEKKIKRALEKIRFLPFKGVLDSNGCQFILRRKYSFIPVKMFIYSAKLPKYNFTSFNLVGLYATVVFTVAQLFRMMHADMTMRIQYDDLPNPLPLLIMCQQILMMRELGDFESEEAIYWQLIEILRNPQVLIQMTKI